MTLRTSNAPAAAGLQPVQLGRQIDPVIPVSPANKHVRHPVLHVRHRRYLPVKTGGGFVSVLLKQALVQQVEALRLAAAATAARKVRELVRQQTSALD
ncbi:MAG: hypothetical protein AAB490_02900 [Patescibacteria group bacterium]